MGEHKFSTALITFIAYMHEYLSVFWMSYGEWIWWTKQAALKEMNLTYLNSDFKYVM